MKVFFTTPLKGKPQYQVYIDEIIRIIEVHGATVVSPEKDEQYQQAFTKEKLAEYGDRDRAHYEFIRQGIASADAVVFEASYEDFRVGHEATLSLMYGKPVLVLSQNVDYGRYIYHEKFIGKKYTDKKELRKIIEDFLAAVKALSNKESFQVIHDIVDLQHSATLSKLRYRASQGTTYFADWARRATKEPDVVYREILNKLGDLAIQKPWDVFAKIYNEDTPDSIFYGAVKFVDQVFRAHQVFKSDHVVDVACGTGAISRILTTFGYRNVTAFDRSRAMLSEAYRLSAHMPSIKIMEGDIERVNLEQPAKAMVWYDFSSNFALDERELERWLTNLLKNLAPSGTLIFNVRTKTGWNIDFFKQKVTLYETDRFQRVWINLPDYKKDLITFDIFIRVKDKDGAWLPWEREQMTERMWRLSEIKRVVERLESITIEATLGDDYTPVKGTREPGLTYFVLSKK
ncbi:hypothetical protein A3A64_00320 [Candidatus Gottesmanbacteria bacterium RIFCSPLOWO2_01_FULL_48_11]|uniref:Methyltransferase domain-containing protein n=1 Tax=Candidatus Gottesmanbacteria bacterium RIFCSPLOWO2_01_FULL_48_11 TaxID=1798395 RepID=A0A1F6ARY5_9BACT|nr:MAG: hypothetical protein A3A64_00320 [Candidatus Gottesmanbacteria bacterium RIFCSPLOWO2_01_FULL_48_11]